MRRDPFQKKQGIDAGLKDAPQRQRQFLRGRDALAQDPAEAALIPQRAIGQFRSQRPVPCGAVSRSGRRGLFPPTPRRRLPVRRGSGNLLQSGLDRAARRMVGVQQTKSPHGQSQRTPSQTAQPCLFPKQAVRLSGSSMAYHNGCSLYVSPVPLGPVNTIRSLFWGEGNPLALLSMPVRPYGLTGTALWAAFRSPPAREGPAFSQRSKKRRSRHPSPPQASYPFPSALLLEEESRERGDPPQRQMRRGQFSCLIE